MNKAISRETATRICEQVQTKNIKKQFGISKMQCWVCVKCTKGDPANKLFACQKDNRGCNLVNEVYDKQITS
jgi:hypothetical protein